MKGKFHSHITIQANDTAEAIQAATSVYGKLTIIDLSRDDHSQRDWMITRHYLTGYHGLEDHNDILAVLHDNVRQLTASGIQVLRAKLEYEFLDPHSAQQDLAAALATPYTEIHIKCRLDAAQLPELCRQADLCGWHPSRNPLSKSINGLTQFINRRFYAERSLPELNDKVDEITGCIKSIDGLQIEEIKYESAVYDSNEEHDRWWMAPT